MFGIKGKRNQEIMAMAAYLPTTGAKIVLTDAHSNYLCFKDRSGTDNFCFLHQKQPKNGTVKGRSKVVGSTKRKLRN